MEELIPAERKNILPPTTPLRYEAAVAQIINFIANTNLKPGDKLPTEAVLSQQLSVSRTVLREAIKVLASAGMVRSRQGSGLYVASEPQPFVTIVVDATLSFDQNQVVNLYAFRRIQEMEAARLAAEHITLRELRALEEAVELNAHGGAIGDPDIFSAGDMQFHQGIARAARNPFIASTVAAILQMQNQAASLIWTGISSTDGRGNDAKLVALEDHKQLLNAIREGQPELSALAAEQHIRHSLQAYQEQVRYLLSQKPHKDN